MWLTNKKTGAKFNTDWIKDRIRKKTDWMLADEIKKFNQIKANQMEAQTVSRNSSKPVRHYNPYHYYSDMLSMMYAFEERTGMSVIGYENLEFYNDLTMADVCEQLEELQNKYPISSDSNPLQLYLPSPSEFESKKDENVFASASRDTITLNPKYFSLSSEDFADVYEEGVKSWYHPVGTTWKDIIAHEYAHSMLDRIVYRRCEDEVKAAGSKFIDTDALEKYAVCQKWLLDDTPLKNDSYDISLYDDDGTLNKTLLSLKQSFKTAEHRIDDVPAVKEYLGSDITRYSLLGKVDSTMVDLAISDYASTNYHELVAEAFADFWANGSNAKDASKIIVDELLELR